MRTRHRLLTGLTAAALLVTAGCDTDDTESNAPADDTTEEAPTDDEGSAEQDQAEQDQADEEQDDVEVLDETAEEAPTTTDEEQTEAPESVSLTVEESDAGEHLATDDGRSVYVHALEGSGDEPTCSTDCATVWQPVPAASEQDLGDDIDEELVGTVEREDLASIGVEEQLTYNDYPLYTFVSDAGAGDVRGQGSADLWFLVGPDGEPIGEVPSEEELEELDMSDVEE